jgi:(2R)-ethylmalonyl-CoA mutase
MGRVMREVHGEYRGPTGVSQATPRTRPRAGRIRARGRCGVDRLGRRLKFLVGKPGLDGHSNGAEQIAFRARDCGMDITYEGIRLTPEEIVDAARRGESAMWSACRSCRAAMCRWSKT